MRCLANEQAYINNDHLNNRFNGHYNSIKEVIDMARKHSKYCDGFMCDGSGKCPITGKLECGKELNYKVYSDGHTEVVTIFCFGCNKLHGVALKSD